MSWFLNSVGPNAAVRTEVAANSTLPESLKQHILELLDEAAPNQNGHDGVIVKGSGHHGGGYGGIMSLSFERVKLAK